MNIKLKAVKIKVFFQQRISILLLVFLLIETANSTALLTSCNFISFASAESELSYNGLYFITTQTDALALMSYYGSFARTNSYHAFHDFQYYPLDEAQVPLNIKTFQAEIELNFNPVNGSTVNIYDRRYNSSDLVDMSKAGCVSYSSNGYVRLFYVTTNFTLEDNDSLNYYYVFYCYEFNTNTNTRIIYPVLNTTRYITYDWGINTYFIPCSVLSGNESVFFIPLRNYHNGTLDLWAITFNKDGFTEQLFKIPHAGETVYTVYVPDRDYYFIMFQNMTNETPRSLYYTYYFMANQSLAKPQLLSMSPAIDPLPERPTRLLYDSSTEQLYLLMLAEADLNFNTGKFFIYHFDITNQKLTLESKCDQVLFSLYKNYYPDAWIEHHSYEMPLAYYDCMTTDGVLHILAFTPSPYSNTKYELSEVTYRLGNPDSWSIVTKDLPQTINPFAASYIYNVTSQSYIDGMYNVLGILNDTRSYPIPPQHESNNLYFLTCLYLYGLNYSVSPYFFNYYIYHGPNIPLIASLIGVFGTGIIVSVIFVFKRKGKL